MSKELFEPNLKYEKMTQQKLREVWGKDARKFLIGKRIVDVYYHNKKQNDEIFYDDYQSNIRIVFDDGHWITASKDDEGNGSGVIFTTNPKLPTIPSISFDNEEVNNE